MLLLMKYEPACENIHLSLQCPTNQYKPQFIIYKNVKNSHLTFFFKSRIYNYYDHSPMFSITMTRLQTRDRQIHMLEVHFFCVPFKNLPLLWLICKCQEQIKWVQINHLDFRYIRQHRKYYK